MKIFLPIILFILAFSAGAQLVTNQPARLKTKVNSYEGKINSGVRGTEINFVPESTYFGNGGADTVTSSGHESELKWTFVGRSKDKDVYRFTFSRMTKAGSSDKTTTSK
jgi:hypothetical protein